MKFTISEYPSGRDKGWHVVVDAGPLLSKPAALALNKALKEWLETYDSRPLSPPTLGVSVSDSIQLDDKTG